MKQKTEALPGGTANIASVEKSGFFAGLTWDEVGAGSLGVAVGYSDIVEGSEEEYMYCLLYTSPSPRDNGRSRMPSSA